MVEHKEIMTMHGLKTLSIIDGVLQTIVRLRK